MIRLFATRLVLLLALVAPPALAAEVTPGPGPQEVIETAAKKMLVALDADRELARKDPKRVERLVEEILLPGFDTDESARRVLGTHWTRAKPEDRQRFIDAFYQSLLQNYGSALAEFTADRMVMLPFRGDVSTGNATVRTEVKRRDGTRVPVNYSLHATPRGWKAWDVTIEGISYVRNLRNDIGAEISQKGLIPVIERLERENRGGKAEGR